LLKIILNSFDINHDMDYNGKRAICNSAIFIKTITLGRVTFTKREVLKHIKSAIVSDYLLNSVRITNERIRTDT